MEISWEWFRMQHVAQQRDVAAQVAMVVLPGPLH
jgi:hypothetical protein